ncbi:NAD(P)-dependent oxidoreductase [Streptomyces marincola]|uniref:NmrA family transcriptional regulator n=1 Tax=Streptomyces marincola TaxID=2878388 RepID=A0A1W7D136_9ACTN|nr:NAD(P)H-binding protein [Streptomyces marincola]ARQ70746.1 NmrA family transcriptional regulator [Streptomyces marincola]
MSRIVVFGAGGRAGRHAVAEAAARGHQVTAVVRDPAAHHDLTADSVTVSPGDVTDADSVATVAAGHDAAIHAAARLDVPPRQFYVSAAHALLDGLPRAGVGRVVLIGIGTTLETAPGVPIHETPGFPEDGRAFSLGHAAALDTLRAAETAIDWLVLAPPPVPLDNEAPRTGRYRIGGTQAPPTADSAPAFSYADLAVALIDEAATPTYHRSLHSVTP